MAYAGYLIKLGGSSGTVLPLEFVKAESYDVESGRLTEKIRQDYPQLPAFEEFSDLMAAIKKEMGMI